MWESCPNLSVPRRRHSWFHVVTTKPWPIEFAGLKRKGQGAAAEPLGRELRNRAIRDFSPEPAVARYEDVLSNVVVRVPFGAERRS